MLVFNPSQISLAQLLNEARANRGKISHIYLHWTAGRYNQFFDDYHLNIDGEGKVAATVSNGVTLTPTITNLALDTSDMGDGLFDGAVNDNPNNNESTATYGFTLSGINATVGEKYRVIVWAHHGLFVCGDDFDEAFGLMDTVEKASEICVKVLSMGGKKQTIPREGFIQLAKDFHIDLNTELLD